MMQKQKIAAVTTPEVTVGVVTHRKSKHFAAFLSGIVPTVEAYSGICHLLVCNNSGIEHRKFVENIIACSGIREIMSVTLLDSPQNNISVGRNLIIDNTDSPFLAFLDDDETPSRAWLSALVGQQMKNECDVVAGPVFAIYDSSTPKWIRVMDLHNHKTKRTGDSVTRAGSGNVLLRVAALGEQRFDLAYGKSGGSDTDFFFRLHDLKLDMRWSDEAVATETIPADRSTATFVLYRLIVQGGNYRHIMHKNDKIVSKPKFYLRALMLTLVAIPLGGMFIPFHSKKAAFWLKMGFSNLGKLYTPSKKLYG